MLVPYWKVMTLDVTVVSLQAFCLAWYSRSSPQLAYSAVLKGPICRYSILFPQPIVRGGTGHIYYRSLDYVQILS